MAKKKKAKTKSDSVDAGNAESPEFIANAEIQQDFEEAAQLGSAERSQLIDKLREHRETSPTLSGGDIDAAWEDSDVGEESVGGGNPTPDQDVVEELGRAVGLTYEDNEPLRTTEKVDERDKHRWELDPASSDGFEERSKHEGEYEES